MGSESRQIKEAVEASKDFISHEEPAFGTMNAHSPIAKEAEIRYLVGCMNEPETRLQVEDLMTRSMQGRGVVKKPGDVLVVSEQGTFDKEGLYQVIVKYIIYPDRA